MGSIKLPAAEHLNKEEEALLLKVYSKHNRSMGMEERAHHTLSHIFKVERNLKDGFLNVHYSNGNWWRYKFDGSWY